MKRKGFRSDLTFDGKPLSPQTEEGIGKWTRKGSGSLKEGEKGEVVFVRTLEEWTEDPRREYGFHR